MRKLLVLAMLLIPVFAGAQSVAWRGPEVYKCLETPSKAVYVYDIPGGDYALQNISRIDPASGAVLWTIPVTRNSSGFRLATAPTGFYAEFIASDTSEVDSYDSTGARLWEIKLAGMHEFCVDKAGFIYAASYDSVLERYSPSGQKLWSKKIPGLASTLLPNIADGAGNYCGFIVDDVQKGEKTLRTFTVLKVDAMTGNVVLRKLINSSVLESNNLKGAKSNFYSHEIDPILQPMLIGDQVVLFGISNLIQEKITPGTHKYDAVASMVAFSLSPDGKVKTSEFKSKGLSYVKGKTENGKNSFVETQGLCGVSDNNSVFLFGNIGRGKLAASSLASAEFHSGGAHNDALILRYDVQKARFQQVISFPDYRDQIWGQYIGSNNILVGIKSEGTPTTWSVVDSKGKSSVPAPGFVDDLLRIERASLSSGVYFAGPGATASVLVKYDFSALLSKAAPAPSVTASAVPANFELHQNYPNPFNPSTQIHFALPVESQVHLTIFNTLGQQIAQLVNGIQSAGEHSLAWDATNFSSGVYFYQIEAVGTTDPSRTFRSMGKMVLAK